MVDFFGEGRVAGCSRCMLWRCTWDLPVILKDHRLRPRSLLSVWSLRWGHFKALYVKFLWQLTDMGTATRCPPLIHNQPSNTLLPQWFNCPICHRCCSHQNKRRDNDHFHPRTNHAVFHSWSKVSKTPHFRVDKLYPLLSVTFFVALSSHLLPAFV